MTDNNSQVGKAQGTKEAKRLKTNIVLPGQKPFAMNFPFMGGMGLSGMGNLS